MRVIIHLAPRHSDKRYVILADVFQTLRYFEYWTSFSVRQEV